MSCGRRGDVGLVSLYNTGFLHVTSPPPSIMRSDTNLGRIVAGRFGKGFSEI